ncbi:MAG: hypothetical protein ACYC2H_02305 [Thermoplasmatota archaeon]
MRWSLALGLLFLTPILAGCIAGTPDDPAGTPTSGPGPGKPFQSGTSSRSSTASSAPRPPAGGIGGNSSGELDGNVSGNVSGPPREWAALGAATIRPGVQIVVSGSQCTSNFLFTSPDNATVYIGFAAHCVTRNDPNNADDGCDPASEPLAVGTKVEVEGADHPALLAYTSWGSMQANGGAGSETCLYNDFAVAELDPRDAAKANPAMLFFGGPTALADPADVGTLDKVLTYGDSGLRAGLSTLSPHEGYVVFSPGPEGWTTEVYTLPQGIPGDSGSGVLMGGDGAALGILVTISYAGGSNGVTTLANAMQYAEEKAGLPLRLATAPVIDDGVLPGL